MFLLQLLCLVVKAATCQLGGQVLHPIIIIITTTIIIKSNLAFINYPTVAKEAASQI